MTYDTAGNKIEEMIPNCHCSLTGGCEKCNSILYKSKLPSFIGCISDEEAEKMKKEVANFRNRFDKDMQKRSKKLWGMFKGAEFKEEDFDRGVRIPTKLYERLVNALETWLVPSDVDQGKWQEDLLKKLKELTP